VVPLPEGVAAYPRWQGQLAERPATATVFVGEARRGLLNPWLQYGVLLFVFIGVLYSALVRQAGGLDVMTNLTGYLGILLWSALVVGAVMGAPALLEDAHSGALELYLARGVTARQYLLGKGLAVFAVAWLAVAGPVLVYWVQTVFTVKPLPDHWFEVPLGVAAQGALWAFVIAGLSLALSCVSRSARAASILLLGSFIVMDVFVSSLLQGITRIPQLALLSPLQAVTELGPTLYHATDPGQFPPLWGLGELLALAVVGWGIVAWKHPRLPGAA
jgi:ABC-type transport system involved in multi-copper enzyme maturation permease subunit